jgi:hypothetical protein
MHTPHSLLHCTNRINILCTYLFFVGLTLQGCDDDSPTPDSPDNPTVS